MKKATKSFFRISLCGLFIIATICAILLGFCATRAHQQRAVVSEIRRLGGEVDYTSPIVHSAERFLPIDFVRNVEVVTIRRFDVEFATDVTAMISQLKQLRHLKQVLLWDWNHREFEQQFRKSLPGVEIVLQRGGVIG